MTFEEVRELLINLRAAKRRANSIKARIADLESDYESIQSALSGRGMPSGGLNESRIEQMILRVEKERERHLHALEAFFALEDKLAEAFNTLNEEEREIIISVYIDGKRIWKVAENMSYSEITIKRKKHDAIVKITKYIKQ